MEERPKFRIRKLTPRECFRLMDVSEKHIDDIQNYKENGKGISRSQQYRMAGNSIVVSCMVELFRNLFIETEHKPKRGEQLFFDF